MPLPCLIVEREVGRKGLASHSCTGGLQLHANRISHMYLTTKVCTLFNGCRVNAAHFVWLVESRLVWKQRCPKQSLPDLSLMLLA